MSQLDTHTPPIDQGIDRKSLRIIKQRFFEVNNARLARTKSALGARQQIFLELLPMLFHSNHPMLPGYVSHQTPNGVTGYNPGKIEIQKTQRLARSFTYRRQPTMRRRIHGIFLMGSCGTVAQSEKSDLDIWICHPALSTEEQSLLRQKCDDISRWCLTIDLEVHFFLMHDEKFRQGHREDLTTEDCGSSQHYLLLDEFYRTALFIAGRVPLWWLIPPEEEANYDDYAKTLRTKRYVQNDDILDFGGVGRIPAGEFIGAGVWQLYKAIDSPYKSVLKILLTEAYADEYPEVEPLSGQFKQAIYDNNLDIDELDPYVVVYRKLENYLLARNEHKRLELVRRCFYFKVGKSLSKPGHNNNISWQRRLMEKLITQWEWPREHLYNLDARNQWRVGRVIEEQKLLVRELTNSYRFVLELARRTRATALINSKEMTILGRKLYAAFERKAGKIEWVNPGIADDLVEQNLTFYPSPSTGQSIDSSGWAVSDQRINSQDIPRDKPIKRADCLISLLAWCHFNNLLSSSTYLSVIEGSHGVTDFELQSITRSIRQRLPIAKQFHGDDEAHRQFSRAMFPASIHLFVNVGIDPLDNLRNQGTELLSGHTDSLGYSGLKENLVLNLEQVLVNSWGELSSHSYNGELALIRCLRDYLLLIPPGSQRALPTLDIQCFCPSRANAIKLRLEELFRDIAACYHSGTRPASSRYVIEIQREYYVLQFEDKHPNIEKAGNYNELLTFLARPQKHYSPIVLDRYCLANSILAAICNNSLPDQIQVFYQSHDQQADVYVVDEKGSLLYFTTPFFNEYSLLSPLDQFIQSTLFRRNSETLLDSPSANKNIDLEQFNFNHFELHYYQISQTANNTQLIRRSISEELRAGNFFNVQAIGDTGFNDRILFNIYCDQQEFTELELGKELYSTAAKFILNRRQSKQRYPCYITDLDLSRCDNKAQANESRQTVYYLRHKLQLERALNSALQIV